MLCSKPPLSPVPDVFTLTGLAESLVALGAGGGGANVGGGGGGGGAATAAEGGVGGAADPSIGVTGSAGVLSANGADLGADDSGGGG